MSYVILPAEGEASVSTFTMDKDDWSLFLAADYWFWNDLDAVFDPPVQEIIIGDECYFPVTPWARLELGGGSELTTLALGDGFMANGEYGFWSLAKLENVNWPSELLDVDSWPPERDFGGVAAYECALSQASVDEGLAACVAGGMTSAEYTGGIMWDSSGGTSATPSAAGLADKATLVARGWAVVHN